MPVFPVAAGICFWAGWTLQWSYEPQSPSYLAPLVPLCPMWCTIQTSTLCPKLTFKIPLCLISFFLGKVSPLPGCMWEIMFWSVLHGKRLAEECHHWVLPERNWRCRVWRVWRQGRAVLCFFSLPAPSVSSTAKKGVWKQIYWDH